MGVAAGGGAHSSRSPARALVTREHGVDCYDIDTQKQIHSWPLHAGGKAGGSGGGDKAAFALAAVWDAATAQHIAVLQASKGGSGGGHSVLCWGAEHPPTAPLAGVRTAALSSPALALFAAAASRPRRARAEDMVLDDASHRAGVSRCVCRRGAG